MKRLFIATGNAHKIKEIKGILLNQPFEIICVSDYAKTLPEVSEGEISYKENAVKKAVHYSNLTGFVSLADDTGLEVKALGGKPGIRSARFFGDSVKPKYLSLIELLKEQTDLSDLSAQFVCETAIAFKNEILGTFRGLLEGKITLEPRGKQGFGYDPIFMLPNGKTLAELDFEEKNSISHRAIAVKQAVTLINSIKF